MHSIITFNIKQIGKVAKKFVLTIISAKYDRFTQIFTVSGYKLMSFWLNGHHSCQVVLQSCQGYETSF